MHESPVANELVRAALAAARSNRIENIAKMVLNLGPDGGFVADSLRFHISVAANDSIAQDCEIEIIAVQCGGVELVSIESGESS